MYLKLSIDDDAELRGFIRESIKNQIVSIARGEIVEVIKECLSKATKATSVSENIEKLLKQEMNNMLWHLKPDLRETASNFIRDHIKGEVEKTLTPENVAKLIEQQLKVLSFSITTRPGTLKLNGDEATIQL